MTTKEFRKAGFALGFGYVCGKYAAGTLNRTISNLIEYYVNPKLMPYSATKYNNPIAIKYCQKHNLKYGNNDNTKTEDKVEIGFHIS